MPATANARKTDSDARKKAYGLMTVKERQAIRALTQETPVDVKKADALYLRVLRRGTRPAEPARKGKGKGKVTASK
jgi:hypothetical protein